MERQPEEDSIQRKIGVFQFSFQCCQPVEVVEGNDEMQGRNISLHQAVSFGIVGAFPGESNLPSAPVPVLF